VDQVVQLAKRERAVPAQDGETGRPERPTGQGLGILVGGGQRGPVDVGRPSPPAPRDDRVELVAQPGQCVDDGAALVRQGDHAPVDHLEPVDERITVHLSFDA
jgi:hypothetical protein